MSGKATSCGPIRDVWIATGERWKSFDSTRVRGNDRPRNPTAGMFRVWEGDASPPSHSLPPQVVAKSAERMGRVPFRSFQETLFRAYFSDNRDISSPDCLEACWKSAGLPEEHRVGVDDAALQQRVLEDHSEAQDLGATGVPGVRLLDNPAIVMGAQPLDVYRRWVERQLTRAEPSG